MSSMTENSDPYLYPGTSVLKNLRGLTEPNPRRTPNTSAPYRVDRYSCSRSSNRQSWSFAATSARNLSLSTKRSAALWFNALSSVTRRRGDDSKRPCFSTVCRD